MARYAVGKGHMAVIGTGRWNGGGEASERRPACITHIIGFTLIETYYYSCICKRAEEKRKRNEMTPVVANLTLEWACDITLPVLVLV